MSVDSNVEDPQSGVVLHGPKKGQVVAGAGFPGRSGGAPPPSNLPVGDAIGSSEALANMNARNVFGNRGLGARGRKVEGERVTSRTDPGRRALGGQPGVFGSLVTAENIGSALLTGASFLTPAGPVQNLLRLASGANTARRAVSLLGK